MGVRVLSLFLLLLCCCFCVPACCAAAVPIAHESVIFTAKECAKIIRAAEAGVKAGTVHQEQVRTPPAPARPPARTHAPSSSQHSCMAALVLKCVPPRMLQAMLQGPTGAPIRKPDIRDSTNMWVTLGPELDWVRGTIEAVLPAAEAGFGVKSKGLFPRGLVQVARYAKGHHYQWHTDSNNFRINPETGVTDNNGRVLSATVQLSGHEDYSGGEVELGGQLNMSKAVGSVAVFPSYLPHRVCNAIHSDHARRGLPSCCRDAALILAATWLGWCFRQ